MTSTTSTSASVHSLNFLLLPAYAQFLLDNHLEAFADASLKTSREVKVPLLKYFETMPEEELRKLSLQGTRELLGYFATNRVDEYIQHSLEIWKKNQLPLVQSSAVVVEDITSILFVRRKTFRDFLKFYSSDIDMLTGVMEEVDRYSVVVEESSYTVLFDMKERKINEQVEELTYQKEQLLEVQDLAELGSFDWDLNGKTSVYSEQTVKILELGEDNSMAVFIEHVHPSDRGKLNDSIAAALQGNGVYECEYRYKKNGPEKVIWSRGIVTYEDGKPARMRGTIMDVTLRHHMLKRLERSEELHKQAQALTHIGNWSWRMGDATMSWSDELYRIFGFEPQAEAMTLSRFISFIEPLQQETLREQLDHTIAHHEPTHYTVRIVCGDGTRKVIQGNTEVLVDEDGVPYKLVGTCQDITKQYLLNEQLAEKNRALERTNEELTSFNYIASHDLQEPLRKIRTYISRIAEKNYDSLGEDTRDYFDRIADSAARMQKLIEDLIWFSQVSSADKAFSTLELDPVVKEITSAIANAHDDVKVTIIAGKMPEARVIPFQFRQLMENLVSNAVKFRKQGEDARVEIQADVADGSEFSEAGAVPGTKYHHIFVRDHGIGFDQQYADRIFGLFQRLHSRTEYPGTGIGLAICRKVVQNHDGFITVESAPGLGSTFHVLLPL